MGPVYLPIKDDESHLDKIKVEDYEQVLQDNPDLVRHGEFIKEPAHNSRDFKF